MDNEQYTGDGYNESQPGAEPYTADDARTNTDAGHTGQDMGSIAGKPEDADATPHAAVFSEQAQTGYVDSTAEAQRAPYQPAADAALHAPYQPVADAANPAAQMPYQQTADAANPATQHAPYQPVADMYYTAPVQPQSRDEWERQQREIQDREWRIRQQIYNRQLADQRMHPSPRTEFSPRAEYAPNTGYGPNVEYDPRTDYDPRAGQPGQQDGYNEACDWYAGPNGGYAGQHGQHNAHTYAQGGPWPPYGVQDQQQRNTAAYPQNQNNAAPFYQDTAHYYNQQNASANAPYGHPQQGHTRPGPAARKDDKAVKRKLGIRITAAALVAVLLLTAVFTAGNYAGNYGYNIFSALSFDSQTSPEDEVFNDIAQLPQSEPQYGGSSPGGFFGNPQQRPPQFPPSERDNPESSEGSGNEEQRQPERQQPGQATPQTSVSPDEAAALTLNPPHAGELTVPEIYQKVYPSIVGIRITFQSQAYRFGGIMMPGQERSGEGSGIIISSNGYIMTNHHVVSEVIDPNTRAQYDGTKIEVFLPDDSTTAYPAAIVGFDQSTDLCVLKIDKNDLREAELGDADALAVGEFVVAIGNPGGMEYMSSVTFGVISGLNRSIQTEGYRNIQLIQTDAAINPGNSGGALINKNGQVIGVNSIKIANNAFEGLGFAIPINAAVKICEDLMNYTYVTGRPYIGITAYSQYTEQLAEQYHMPKGVYVYEVDETGPSVSIIHRNDIIVKFNSVDVQNFDSLETEKNKHKPGDRVSIQVYRDWSTNDYTNGKYIDVEITLGEKKN